MPGGKIKVKKYKMETRIKTIALLFMLVVLVIGAFGTVLAENETDEGSSEKVSQGSGISGGSGQGSSKPTPAVVDVPEETDVKAKLYPRMEKANKGEVVSYKLYIKDLHSEIIRHNIGGPEEEPTPVHKEYTYNIALKEENNEGIEAKYEDEVTLLQGDQKTLEIEVSSKIEGVNRLTFEISQEGNSKNKVTPKALLLVETGEGPVEDEEFFSGQGFIRNGEDEVAKTLNLDLHKSDSSEKYSEDVNIQKVGAISLEGKASISQTSYLVKGYKVIYPKNPVVLKFYKKGNVVFTGKENSNNHDITYPENPDFRFEGSLSSYENLEILEGTLTGYNGEVDYKWKLMAFSKNKAKNKEYRISLEEESTSRTGRVGKGETLTISSSKDVQASGTSEEKSLKNESSKEEVYVQPTKVSKAKIFNVIPNPFGKKVVEARIISEDSMETFDIKEGQEKTIGSYSVKAKNLSDDKNIEFEISKN